MFIKFLLLIAHMIHQGRLHMLLDDWVDRGVYLQTISVDIVFCTIRFTVLLFTQDRLYLLR